MNRCGYCGTPNHNRRTCPSRPQESKDSDNEYFKKYHNKQRLCSYCYEGGHNVRSCKKHDSDKEIWVKNNAAYRKRMLEDFKQNGFGIGAMLCRKSSWEVESEAHFFFVKSIDWDAITYQNRHSYALNVIVMSSGRETNINIPYYFGAEGETRDYYENKAIDKLRVVSPTTSEVIESSVPNGWLDGRTGMPNRINL